MATAGQWPSVTHPVAAPAPRGQASVQIRPSPANNSSWGAPNKSPTGNFTTAPPSTSSILGKPAVSEHANPVWTPLDQIASPSTPKAPVASITNVTTIGADTIAVVDNGKGKIADYPDVSNPKYVGPGKWHSIHVYAFASRTVEEQKQFVKYMKLQCSKFPCKKCRGHCGTYMIDNDIEKYVGKKLTVDGVQQEDGLSIFYWTIEFHNAVNIRTGKATMSWSEALNLFGTDPDVCSAECSGLEIDGESGQESGPVSPPVATTPLVPVAYNATVPKPRFARQAQRTPQ